MKHAHHREITSPGEFFVRSFRFLGHLTEYCRALGPKAGFRWYCARILGRLRVPGAKQIALKPPDVHYPVEVGLRPVSDEYVFDQIFVHHEYAPICERLDHERLRDEKVILDLGANVGYASAFLACRYPSARILAVEPDPRNFEICSHNLEPYGDRLRILKGAVWSRCSKLALSHELGPGMATQVVPAERESEAHVDAWDIPTLLDMAQADTADLVKIDIEGSEVELFSMNAARWLPRVRNICIELHDQRCRDIFFRALSGFDYDLAETGESTMCLNLRARVPSAQPRGTPASARA